MLKFLKWFKSPSWKEMTSTPEYKQIATNAENFKLIEGKSYQWVYEYAVEQFKDVTDTNDDLDTKADSMLKYFVPGSGLVSLIAYFLAIHNNYHNIAIILFIGIVLIICAMISAALAVMPQQQCLLPPINEVFDTVNHYDTDEQAKVNLTYGIQKAIEIKSIVAVFKAKLIKMSYILFAVTIALLFIGIPIIFFVS